jgi:uncharacterized protein YbaR (Trm112 family)
MNIEILDILRCPFCGGRLELVGTMFHQATAERIENGILACECCTFPVVDGIPVLHLQPAAVTAREHVEAGRTADALRAMVGLVNPAEAEQFEAVAQSGTATYKETVEALGPNFEGGYFLYRFSDPTYLVANAVVRAVAGTVLGGRRRAIDICGGSGHLTRSLLDLSSPPPVLADLFFAKIWLARRFTSPGCVPVCCDGNSPMPFARGAFGYAMCSDAFQYIWTKRLFVGELSRLVDSDTPGAVVINHTHNQITWSPSHGQPLTPAGYRHLYETLPVRLYGEAGLFADVVRGGPLDLSRVDAPANLDGDPALTIVASRHPGVFAPHTLGAQTNPASELRINPLYAVDERGAELLLRLQFPDASYEDEYAACKQYLPDTAVVDRAALAALQARTVSPSSSPLADLVRRRVIIGLPVRYY